MIYDIERITNEKVLDIYYDLDHFQDIMKDEDIFNSFMEEIDDDYIRKDTRIDIYKKIIDKLRNG